MPVDLLQYYMFEELKIVSEHAQRAPPPPPPPARASPPCRLPPPPPPPQIREIGRKCLFPAPRDGSPQMQKEAAEAAVAAAAAAAAASAAAADAAEDLTKKVAMEMDAAVLPS
jgi:hypothetical protein